MTTALVGAGAALAGVLLGYFFRTREFRREHRLAACGEFAAAFTELVHVGTSLLSLGFQHGDSMRGDPRFKQPFDAWNDVSSAFETADARLHLIGGPKTRAKANELATYIAGNIRTASPFVTLDVARTAMGDDVRVGPAHVERRALALKDEFLAVARAELGAN